MKFQAIITERFDHDLDDDIQFYQNNVARPFFVETTPSPLTSPLRYVEIGLQLFTPLAELKKINRNHGDVKLENFLVKLPDRLVLSDWGFSHDLTKIYPQFRHTPCYVYDKDVERWTECKDRNDPQKYAELMTAADVFAMGLVYYMILVRETEPPGAEDENGHISEDIDLDYELMKENHVPPDVMTLIADCLEPNYEARPSAAVVVERLHKIQQAIIAFHSR